MFFLFKFLSSLKIFFDSSCANFKTFICLKILYYLKYKLQLNLGGMSMMYKEKFNEWLNSAVIAEEVKEELKINYR